MSTLFHLLLGAAEVLIGNDKWNEETDDTKSMRMENPVEALYRKSDGVSRRNLRVMAYSMKRLDFSPLLKSFFSLSIVHRNDLQWVSLLDSLDAALVCAPSCTRMPCANSPICVVGCVLVWWTGVYPHVEPWEHVLYMTVGGFSFYYGKKFIVCVCGMGVMK